MFQQAFWSTGWSGILVSVTCNTALSACAASMGWIQRGGSGAAFCAAAFAALEPRGCIMPPPLFPFISPAAESNWGGGEGRREGQGETAPVFIPRDLDPQKPGLWPAPTLDSWWAQTSSLSLCHLRSNLSAYIGNQLREPHCPCPIP